MTTYESLYKRDLERAIVSMVQKNDLIGINVKPELYQFNPSHKNRYAHVIQLMNYFDANGIPYINFEDEELRTSDGSMSVKDTQIDLLFNRRIGMCESFKLILSDRKNLDKYNTISPLRTTEFLINKLETCNALKETVDIPLTFLATTTEEAKDYASMIINKTRTIELYEPPYALLKPIDGTGGQGIIFIHDPNEIKPIEKPILVQQRITTPLIEGRMFDIRTYFIDGWCSQLLVTN